jgi:hypothetical protein
MASKFQSAYDKLGPVEREANADADYVDDVVWIQNQTEQED